MGRIHYPFAVDPTDTHTGQRAVEGNVRNVQRHRGAQHGDDIGTVLFAGDHHPSAVAQLVDQLVGSVARLGGHQDPVVRRVVRQAEDARRPGLDRRPRLVGGGQVGGAERRPGRARSRRPGPRRCGPVRCASSAVLQPDPDPTSSTRCPGPHVEQPQHRLDRPRLRVGLAVPDRERAVVAGHPPLAARQEAGARKGLERGPDGVHRPPSQPPGRFLGGSGTNIDVRAAYSG